MIAVNSVTEAKAQLSSLIEQVLAGHDVVISRSKKPVAMLTAFRKPQKKRKPGALRGKIRISKDFDELPADLAMAFGMVHK